MAEPGIIRMDGVEYDITGGPTPSLCGEYTLLVRPKRKQTGVVCRACREGEKCVRLTPAPADLSVYKCPLGLTPMMKWEPFYGKVGEDP